MKQILLALSAITLLACSLQRINPEATAEVEITPTLSDSPTLATLCEQKGYTSNADSSCSFIQEGNETQPSLRIHYPIELLPSTLIESTIDTYLADYRAEFMQSFEESHQADSSPWFLEITYAIYHHSPTILSTRFDESWYTGGAHPNLTYTSFTFDSATNTILAFEDLFAEGINPLERIVPLARSGLVEKLSGLGVEVDTTDSSIIEGTNDISDFRNFALTETELLLFFEPYQVAPGAAGPQEIQIPLRSLTGVLRDF
jgi:peptidoglycan-N-acetylglucosamine deacetylase